MAQHKHRTKKATRSTGLISTRQGIIAAIVALAILSGGVGWLNQRLAFLHL